jgi:hypothetical protein
MDSFGSSQKIGEKISLQSHDYYGYPHKNVFDPIKPVNGLKIT